LCLCLVVAWPIGVAGAQADQTEGTASVSATELNNQGVRAAQMKDFDKAVSLLRQALAIAPEDVQIRGNLANVLVGWAAELDTKGQWQQALPLLDEAVRVDPSNGQAKVHMGEILYATQGDLEGALALWKSAFMKVAPAQQAVLSDRIAQVQRDLAIERGFQGRDTPHIRIRYETPPDVKELDRLTQALENASIRLKEWLGVTIPPVTVLVYTSDQFQKVVGRRDWALGLYDGRVRLRKEDLGTKQGEWILVHEMAHAYLAKGFGARLPIWIQEGFAQYCEASLAEETERYPFDLTPLKREDWVPLKWIDQKFLRPSGHHDLAKAYRQSVQAVAYLIQKGDRDRFRTFLRRLGNGESVEKVFDECFSPLRWAAFEQGIWDE